MAHTINFDSSKSEESLHVDANAVGTTTDKHGELCTHIADEIERWVRKENGGDMDRKLCGGCINTLMHNLPRELVERGDVTCKTAARIFGNLGDHFYELGYAAGRLGDRKLNKMISESKGK